MNEIKIEALGRMKEMTLLIARVSSSDSFPHGGKRIVMGTCSPVCSEGSLHRNSELCRTEEIKSNVVLSPAFPLLPKAVRESP